VLVDLDEKEIKFLLALLEADKQTALQLLAADHFYEPKLLPKLRNAQREERLRAKEAG
jgi:choline kinase